MKDNYVDLLMEALGPESIRKFSQIFQVGEWKTKKEKRENDIVDMGKGIEASVTFKQPITFQQLKTKNGNIEYTRWR